MNQDMGVSISWRPGDFAVSHDVYFGDNFNDVNEASRTNPQDVLVGQNQEDTTYDPPGLLEFGQSYYWRIDEFNDTEPNSPWKGSTWSFTVIDHFIVDNFEDYTDDEVSHCIEMLYGESGPSHAAYAAALPLDHEPGTVYSYSSGTTNIVARIVGDIVTGAVGGDPAERRMAMEAFLRHRLFGPVGMESAIPKFDDGGDFVGSSSVFATARDFARFGELYRHDGVTAGGERILPEGWVEHAAIAVSHDDENGCDFGRHWWMWPKVPGSLACHGHEGQYVVVVPDRELVVVHLGKTDSSVAPQLRARLRQMIDVF